MPNAMHPRIAELVAYLDKQHENLRSAYELVPPERRAIRPAAERWSPAEVVHHITLVERNVVEKLGALVEEARALPNESELSSLFPSALVSLVELRTRRVRTVEYAEPLDSDVERVWQDYIATRSALKEIIAAGDGLAFRCRQRAAPAAWALHRVRVDRFCGRARGAPRGPDSRDDDFARVVRSSGSK